MVEPRGSRAATGPTRAARRAWRSVGVLCSIVALAMVTVFAVAASRVVQNGRTDDARSADAIIVLGAAQFDGRPQQHLTARLQHAQALYDDGVAPRILTLGGKQQGDRFTEAEAGRNWLVDHGVPSSAVVPVGEGNNTLQSVRSASSVLKRHGWRTAVVVTDPWHELRSTTMLDDQGIESFGSPATTGPSVTGGWGSKARYVVRETAAYLVYLARRVLA